MAKIGSRTKGGAEEEQELFVIVNAQTHQRIYVGEGAPEKEAQRVADGLAVDTLVVPAADVVNRKYQPAETVEE